MNVYVGETLITDFCVLCFKSMLLSQSFAFMTPRPTPRGHILHHNKFGMELESLASQLQQILMWQMVRMSLGCCLLVARKPFTSCNKYWVEFFPSLPERHTLPPILNLFSSSAGPLPYLPLLSDPYITQPFYPHTTLLVLLFFLALCFPLIGLLALPPSSSLPFFFCSTLLLFSSLLF